MSQADYNKLKAIFLNPRRGLQGVERLIAEAEKDGLNLTRAQIRKWYKNQISAQVFKRPITKRTEYIPVKCPSNTIGCLQGDLLDISRFRGHNNQVKFLLNIIDLNSRYAWSYPIRSKRPATIAPLVERTIKQVREKHPYKPMSFTTDDGTEFKGAVKTLLQRYDVMQFQQDTKWNTAPIERWNQTLWAMFRRYAEQSGRYDFVRHLDDFVHNYNNTVHSSTKMKPNEVFNSTSGLNDDRKKPPVKIQVGDKVRYAIDQKRFSKRAFVPKYSRKVFTVIEKDRNRYILKSADGTILQRKYLQRELQKIGEAPSLFDNADEEDDDDDDEPEDLDEAEEQNDRQNRFERRQQREPEVPARMRPQGEQRQRNRPARLRDYILD